MDAWRHFRQRYTVVDGIIFAAASLLCLLSVAFSRTAGFVSSTAVGAASGADADGRIVAGAFLFGFIVALFGWWPGRGLAALVKVLAFAWVWLFQLGLLGGVDLAALRHALFAVPNPVLGIWLIVFLGALPCVGAAFFLTLSRFTEPTSDALPAH